MDRGSLINASINSLASFFRFFSYIERVELKFLIFICVDTIYKVVKTKLRSKAVKKIVKKVLFLENIIISFIVKLLIKVIVAKILVVKDTTFTIFDMAFSFWRFRVNKFYAIGESMSSIFFKGIG